MAEFIRFNISENSVPLEVMLNVNHIATAKIDHENQRITLKVDIESGSKQFQLFSLSGKEAAKVIAALEKLMN